MRNKDFAVFILTHGRPDNVITYHTLTRLGYTGAIYLVIDNEDKAADRYKQIYGDKVIIFDKAEIARTFDEGDNFNDRRAVIYARNACFEIARDLGLKYFLELDDDYYKIQYRINHRFEYPSDNYAILARLDHIFDLLLDFYISIDAKSIAIAQGGDFIGGVPSSGKSWRKCMNTFFCAVDRPFQFVGRINEDVNTYTWYQSIGNLFLTFPFISIGQYQTQDNSGGMTELYLDSGTYVKSFYTIMYSPSCTTINTMGQEYRRLHHSVKWGNAVPCIVSEDYRKASRSERAP